MKKIYSSLIVILSVCFSACNEQPHNLATSIKNAPTKSLTEQKTPTTPKVSTIPSLDKKDYEKFAAEIENYINEGNADFFNKHFKVEPIIKDITSRIKGPTDYEEGFTEGVKTSIDAGNEIVSSLGKKGHYKLLKINKLANKTTALFRLVAEDGINYHEVELASDNEKDIFIKDFCIYRGGMPFSETLEKLYLSSLLDVKEEVTFAENTEREQLFLENLPKISEINELAQISGYKDAVEAIADLPADLQNDRMVQIMNLNLSYNVGEKTFAKAENQFRAAFDNDKILDFMMLDFAFLAKNKNNVVAKIDKLNNALGNDPYLHTIKAEIYQSFEKKDLVENLLSKAIDEEPNTEMMYWKYARFLLDEKRHAEAVDLFSFMQNKFDTDPSTVLAAAKYNDFWSSEEYRNWENSTEAPAAVSTP
ncbi:MAG: hypothetical protein ACPG5B_00230 [Chitinophagales bacterium]